MGLREFLLCSHHILPHHDFLFTSRSVFHVFQTTLDSLCRWGCWIWSSCLSSVLGCRCVPPCPVYSNAGESNLGLRACQAHCWLRPTPSLLTLLLTATLASLQWIEQILRQVSQLYYFLLPEQGRDSFMSCKPCSAILGGTKGSYLELALAP